MDMAIPWKAKKERFIRVGVITTFEQVKRDLVYAMMELMDGNKVMTAKRLGISSRALRLWLAELRKKEPTEKMWAKGMDNSHHFRKRSKT